ncbi:Tim17/Tim22/Tim23/Pmp24 family-domain-containing protein, partial [Protomyces lactucae-debilis]
DASKLHPLAGLNDTLEYLTLEDEALNTLPGSETALPSRGWSDDLSYGTGTTYLTCLGLGGAYGIIEGLRNSKPSDSFRLRLNTVLNSVTRRGPFLGNSGGVVAILYNLINSGIGAVRGRHDTMNAVASGFVAGVLFKSTRGLRPALNAGGLAGAAALIWSLGKTQI